MPQWLHRHDPSGTPKGPPFPTSSPTFIPSRSDGSRPRSGQSFDKGKQQQVTSFACVPRSVTSCFPDGVWSGCVPSRISSPGCPQTRGGQHRGPAFTVSETLSQRKLGISTSRGGPSSEDRPVGTGNGTEIFPKETSCPRIFKDVEASSEGSPIRMQQETDLR